MPQNSTLLGPQLPTPPPALPAGAKPNYQRLAATQAGKLGIDPGIASRLIQTESSWNPNAVSPKGAVGLTQLMPRTAQDQGVDAADPVQNISGGLSYFKQLLDQYKGNYAQALSHYNSGRPDASSPDVQAYVKKVMGDYMPPLPKGAIPRGQKGQQAGTQDTIRAAGPLEGAAQKLRDFVEHKVGYQPGTFASEAANAPMNLVQGFRGLEEGIAGGIEGKPGAIRHTAVGGAGDIANAVFTGAAPLMFASGGAAATEAALGNLGPALGFGGGMGAGYLSNKVLPKLGATSEETNLASNVAQLVGAGLAEGGASAAKASREAEFGRKGESLAATLPKEKQASYQAETEKAVPLTEQEQQIAKLKAASGMPELPKGAVPRGKKPPIEQQQPDFKAAQEAKKSRRLAAATQAKLAVKPGLPAAAEGAGIQGAQVPGTPVGLTGAKEISGTKGVLAAAEQTAGTTRGSKPVKTEREVMQQPAQVSRASQGMAAEGTLPPALKADLEKSAGRKLSDSEAVALDRSRLETQMAGARPGETEAIREAHRATLEKKPVAAAAKPELTEEQAQALIDKNPPKQQKPLTPAQLKKVAEVKMRAGEMPVEAAAEAAKPPMAAKAPRTPSEGLTQKQAPRSLPNFEKAARSLQVPEKGIPRAVEAAKAAWQQAKDSGLTDAEAQKAAARVLAKVKGEAGVLRIGGRSPKDNLEKLTEEIKKLPDRPAEGTFTGRRIDDFVNVGRKFAAGADHVTQTLVDMASHAKAGMDYLSKPPKFDDYHRSLGELSYQNQRASYAIKDYVDAIRAKHDKGTLEGITNWLQAGGDDKLLADRASKSKAAYKSGYEKALRLTPEEKQTASAIKDYYEWRFKEGQLHGIVQHGLENYVNQIWKNAKDMPAGLAGELNAGKLNVNFKYGMKRVLESYFEGEQKGKVPKDKGIDFLLSAYDHAFNRAVTSRAFVKSLAKGKAADGRPNVVWSIAGAKAMLPEEIRNSPQAALIKQYLKANPELKQELTEAYFVNPHAKTAKAAEAYGDYVQKPYRAFEKYLWVSEKDGKPVFYKAQALVHPEIGKNVFGGESLSKINKLMEPSMFRQSKAFRATLEAQAAIKQTLLGASVFHYVQEGYHALFHKINPLGADVVSGKTLQNAFRDPKLVNGLKHGLMLYDKEAASNFQEGVRGGLVEHIPVVGAAFQKLNEHLFERYIPSLKAKMYSVGSSRVDLQACKLEYSIVSPK